MSRPLSWYAISEACGSRAWHMWQLAWATPRPVELKQASPTRITGGDSFIDTRVSTSILKPDKYLLKTIRKFGDF